MSDPSTFSPLGDITIETFLSQYWQKKPLLIRNAFPNFESPLDSDELAGLSIEDDVESRIIVEDGEKTYWELHNGPFTEDDYRELPKDKWTLLVQSADHWSPDVREILEHFRFIPNWRVDDIMISFAVDGGSVGPHYDHYDVFLLQGSGKRHWQVGQACTEDTPLDQSTNLKILEAFYPEEDWVLEPGDMLYIPPQIAHWGIAKGDCITYSIGFRSINHADLINCYSQTVLESLTESQRYTDPNLIAQSHSGEISDEALDKLQASLVDLVKDRNTLARAVGRFSTEPKYPDVMDEDRQDIEPINSWSELSDIIKDCETMYRNDPSRFAYAKLAGDEKNAIQLFVDGDDIICSQETLALIQLICEEYQTPVEELGLHCDIADCQLLLITLFNMGAIYFE